MSRYQQPLGENAKKIKRWVKANPDITAREIVIRLDNVISVQRVYQIVDALRERGEIEEAS